jgi:hypothetical protein
MRIVSLKPQVMPLVSGEVTFKDTSAEAVRKVIELYAERTLQSDFMHRLMTAAAHDNLVMQRIVDLRNREVLVTLDSVDERQGVVIVRYTAYPGNRLDGRVD